MPLWRNVQWPQPETHDPRDGIEARSQPALLRTSLNGFDLVLKIAEGYTDGALAVGEAVEADGTSQTRLPDQRTCAQTADPELSRSC